MLPTSELDASQETGKTERDVYYNMIDLCDTKGTIYTDQTEESPTKSGTGNRYVMIMAAIDSNAVLMAPTERKPDKEQILAYLALLKQLKQVGVEVRKHVLDNECYNKMKGLINSECMMELASPGCHRTTLA